MKLNGPVMRCGLGDGVLYQVWAGDCRMIVLQLVSTWYRWSVLITYRLLNWAKVLGYYGSMIPPEAIK